MYIYIKTEREKKKKTELTRNYHTMDNPTIYKEEKSV